ncbi:MAG: ferrochelatase [Rhodanobacteraceae bacterium]|nr:MAG: ferrochelatase [Rhodanobacteraceae bacterium]
MHPQNETTGLLVMAYGTPHTLQDLRAYYTHIRHGREPSEALQEQLQNRYFAIGGGSPLNRITAEQAAQLTADLSRRFPAQDFRSYIGFKHTAPFIEEAVARMHADGIHKGVALVMAPHYSAFSVRAYRERVTRAAAPLGWPRLVTVDAWYRQPKFIGYWARCISVALQALQPDDRRHAAVIFSAHSLPARILVESDPYVQQVTESAQLIAAAAGLDTYAIGWQSAGRTPDPWIGPDVREVTRNLWNTRQQRTFIYCPIGFVADHLEVLYDNDVECRAVVEELGGAYVRPPMPNIHPLFIAALADAVAEALDRVASVPA